MNVKSKLRPAFIIIITKFANNCIIRTMIHIVAVVVLLHLFATAVLT